MLKGKYFCRIDRKGCVNCGASTFVSKPVINDDLTATWELTPSERKQFDDREGHQCARCGMSKRVRMLSWSIRQFFPAIAGMAILHLNQVNLLGDSLRSAGFLVETFHDQALDLGSRVGSLVNQDMTRLTFADNQFDLVVHSETLEHIHDYRKALEEAGRVLKPGGCQIYTLPLIHGRKTRRRIGLNHKGLDTYTLPLSYHGAEGEYPVVWEFGGDFLQDRMGNISRIQYDNYWRNKTVFSLVERKIIG